MNPEPAMNPDMQLLLPLLSKSIGKPDKYKIALEYLCTALMNAPRELGAILTTLKRMGKIPDWDLAMSLMGPYIDLSTPQTVRWQAEPTETVTAQVDAEVEAEVADKAPRATRAPRTVATPANMDNNNEDLLNMTPLTVSACGDTAEVDSWKRAYIALMGMLLRAGLYDTIPQSWFRDGPASNGRKTEMLIEGRWVYTNLSRADQAARIKSIATLTDTLKVRVLNGDVEVDVDFG